MELPTGLLAWLDDVADALPAPRAELVRRAVTRTFRDAMFREPDGSIQVETGDIPAMWLRDSAAQMRPLIPVAARHTDVAEVLVGVARRASHLIIVDPRANAFRREAGAGPPGPDGRLRGRPLVWERKYEVDSLAWSFDLSIRLAQAGITAHLTPQWLIAAHLTVELWERETQHADSDYRFHRRFVPSHDTLSRRGKGAPVAPTGMTWSGFRPSDDACQFGYLVPSNAFAAVVLDGMGHLAQAHFADDELAERARVLALGIRDGIAKHAVVPAPAGSPVAGEPIWAYEVDGLGGVNVMDDANIPSLLSLPYLGFCAAGDPLYRATRAHVLSPANPWYFDGSQAQGVGSIHTPAGHVWPLAIAMAGLTGSTAEAAAALEMLEATTPDGAMHESFDPDRPGKLTRPWFSWADMTYVQLVLQTAGLDQQM